MKQRTCIRENSGLQLRHTIDEIPVFVRQGKEIL